ncbi:MAG: hypothetical protein KDA45_09775 [Planctomycetales bacterium]|nr:hypothetical protein [Planctomycetales bacterium]
MLTLSSHTKTTIVNAAFLQEVKESNLQLWAVLRQIRDLATSDLDARELSRQLVESIGELRDCIALEFSLEETYGFIDGAGPLAGIGIPDASIAKIQHRELYLQLHELCEQAEEAQYRGTIGRDIALYMRSFQKFDSAFRAHEELESELIRCGLGISADR